MKRNSKLFEQIKPDSLRNSLESIHAKLYRWIVSSDQHDSTPAETSPSHTLKDETDLRDAGIRSNLKRISALGIIMIAMIWITTTSSSLSFDRSILIIGTILALLIALRGFKYIREALNGIGVKEVLTKIGSFIIKPHTRFWIGAVAIGLCFMQVSPVLIEIYGKNVGYDPDAYRRQQLSASAPGLDKNGNPSWLFSDSISTSNGWYVVTKNGRNYWEKIFSGKGNAYLFARIITESANISVRINSTTLDFECSYGENYFSFSLSDDVDFYYVRVDDFYVSIMNAFTIISVMPQVILEGGIDFTFSDDGDIDTSDIQWIDFYGYGELTLLICPDFPMNSLYIAMDKKGDGSSEEEILEIHPWGNGLDTDKGNEFGGTPLLFGLDYAELVEQGQWPKYVIDIKSLGLYNGENAGLHKLGIAADIKQGADDYYAEMGENWNDLRKAHVSYLILVDQDWDSDFISDSDEINKYDMEPTFPDSWGYYSAEPIGDNHYPQDTLFTFYNNYDESMLYLTLFEQADLTEFAPSKVYNVVLDGSPIKTTEYSGGPGNPYFICTNMLVSVGKHELSFTFEGEYTADSVLISLGDIIVYNMPALADANKEDMKTDSDYDGLPDSSDFSPDASLKWDSSKIQQLILPTTTDKDTVLSMQISRPYTDYYNLTHQSDQLYLWNNEAYVEINPIIKLLGNVLSYIDDEGSTALSNDYYTIRQPTSLPIGGLYDSDNYNLNWTSPTCLSYMIGLKNQDIEQGYGKDIETFSAVDYDYVSQNRIGDSLAVDWDNDGYPDVRNYYPVNWQSNIHVSDNMEFDTSSDEDWDSYDTDPSVWARSENGQYLDTLNPLGFFGRWQQPNNDNWDGSKGIWNYMGIQFGYNYPGDSYPGTFHTVGPYPSGFPSGYINEDLPTPQDFDSLYSDLTGNLSKRESQPIEMGVTNKTFEFSYTFPAGHISKINDGNYDGVAGNDPTLDLKLMVQWEVNNLNYTQYNYRTFAEHGKNAEGEYSEYLYYIDIVDDIINVYKCYFLGTAQRGGDLILSCPKDKFNLIMPSLSMYNSFYYDWEDHLGSDHWNIQNDLPGTWYDEQLELAGDTWGCKFGRTDFDTLNHMLIPLHAKFGQSGFSYHLAYYDWDEPIIVQSIKSTEYDVIDYFVGSPKTPIESKVLESIIQNPSIWNSKPVDNWGIDFEDIIYSYSGSGTIVKSMSYKDYAMNKFLDDVRNEEHIGVGWGMKTYDFKSLPLPTDWSFGGSTFFTDVTYNGETREGVVGVSSASHNLVDPLIVDKWKNGSVSFEVATSNEGSEIRVYNQASGSTAVLLKTKLIDNELYWVIDTGIHDGQGNHIINNLGCKIRADRWQYLTIVFNCESDSFGVLWIDDEEKLSPVEEQNNYAFYSDGGVNPNKLVRISYLYLTDVYINQIDCGGLTQIDSEPMIVYTRSHEYTTWDICKLMHSNELKKNTNQVGGIFSYDNRNFYLEYQYSGGKWNPKLYYANEEFSLLSNCLHQFFNDDETLSELGWTTSGTAIIGDDNLLVTDDGDNYYHHYQTLILKGDSSASINFPNPHNKAFLTFEVGLSKKGDYNIVIQAEEQTQGDISQIELVSDGTSDNWIFKCHYEIPSLQQDITITYDTGIGINYGDLYEVKMMIDDFSGGTKLWINNIFAGDFLTVLLGDIYTFSVNNNNNDQSYQISVDNIHEALYPDTLVDTTTNGDQAFEWDFVGLSHNDVYGSDLTYESTQFDYGVYRSGLYMDVDEIAFNGFIDIYGNAWEFDKNPFIEYDSIYEENGLEVPDYAVATTIGHFSNNGQHKEQMTYAYGPKIGTEGAQPVYVKYIVDSSNYDGLYVKSNAGDKLVLNPMSQNVVDFYEWDDLNEWELWDEDFNKEFISSFVSEIHLPDYTSYTGLNIPVGTRLPVGTVITYKVDQTAFAQGFLDLLAGAISSAPKEFKIEYSIGARSNTCAFSTLDLSNKDNESEQEFNSFDILYQDYDFFNIENGQTCLTQGTFISKIPVSINHITIQQKNMNNPTQTEYTSEILDISYAATDVHLDATKDVYNQIDSSNQDFKDYVQYIHDIYVDKDYNELQGLNWDLDNDYTKTKFDSRWTDMVSTHVGNIIWDKHPTGTSISQLMLYEFFRDQQWQKFSLLSESNGIMQSISQERFNPDGYSISGKEFIEHVIGGCNVMIYNSYNGKHRFFIDDLNFPFKDGLFQLTEKGKAMRRLQLIESQSPGFKSSVISNVEEFLTNDEMTSLRNFARGYESTFEEMARYQMYIFTKLQSEYNSMMYGPDEYVYSDEFKAHIEEIVNRFKQVRNIEESYTIRGDRVYGWDPVFKTRGLLDACHLTREFFGELVGNIINEYTSGNIVYLSPAFNRGKGSYLSKNHGLWLGLEFKNNEINFNDLKEHPELWEDLRWPTVDRKLGERISLDDLKQLVEKFNREFSQADRNYFKVFETGKDVTMIDFYKNEKHYTSCSVKIRDVLEVLIYSKFLHTIDNDENSPTYGQEVELNFNEYLKGCMADRKSCDDQYDSLRRRGGLVGIKGEAKVLDLADIKLERIQQFEDIFTKSWGRENHRPYKIFSANDYFNDFDAFVVFSREFIAKHPDRNCLPTLLAKADTIIIAGRLMLFNELREKFKDKVISGDNLKAILESPDGQNIITSWKNGYDTKIHPHCDKVIELITARETSLEKWGLGETKSFNSPKPLKSPDTSEQIKAKRRSGYSGSGAYSIIRYTMEDVSIFELYEDIAYYAKFFFLDGKERQQAIGDVVGLNTLKQSLENNIFLSCFTEDVDLYIILKLREAGYTDNVIATQVIPLRNQAKSNALKFLVADFWSIGERYDDIIEVMFYLSNLYVLGCYLSSGAITEAQYTQALFDLNLGLGLDIASIACLFIATILRYSTNTGALVFNSLGFILQLLGTIVNTIYLVESWASMQLIDKILQTTLIIVQWVGVAAMFVNLAWGLTCSGLGTVLAIVAWICVAITIVWHWRDPVYFNILNFNIYSNDVETRNHGAIVEGIEGSENFIYVKGDDWITEEHRGYVTLNLPYENNDAYYFLVEESPTEELVSMPYTFDMIGSDIPLHTILDFDVYKTGTGWQHNFGIDFYTKLTVVATSFGYVYGSYVDVGANKIKIYDIINHYDPRLIATKDISGTYPIYSMEIYENALYINRQTATSTYTFEVYSIESKTNPTYKYAVGVDTVGQMIGSSYIILVSGTSKTCVIQVHYSVNGISTTLFDGLVTGSVSGLNFPAFSQGIIGFDFVGPSTSVTNWLHIGDGSSEIRLIKFWSTNSYSKMFYETPDYNTFDFYDSDYDIWGDQGYSGATKVIDLNNALGSKVYQFSNAQRSTSVSLICSSNFYVESMLCVEKISGTTGMYIIHLVDQYGTVQIAFAYNIADQKWYYRSPLTGFYWTEAELINQVIPTAMTYQAWKIVSGSSETFSLYLDGIEICEATAFYDPDTTVVSIAYDDTSSGAKMWLAGYRTFSYSHYNPFAEITPSQINTFKFWFNCPDHEVAVFLNGELLDIYKMNVNLGYINSLSFTYSSLSMRNVYSVSLDEDLDRDGLTSKYETLNSLSDVDCDMDNDGMLDGWEVANGLNPLVDDSSGDLDGDLVHNIDEYTAGTSVNCPDSDHDSMPDGWEITYGLNPNSPHDAKLDSDNDGIINIIEYCSSRIYTAALNPTSDDSDGDTMPDDYEMFWIFDPSSAFDKEQDADGDYLQNYRENEEGTNPRVKDTDYDGMWDKWELDNDFDPLWSLDAEMDADYDDFNTVLDPDFEFHNVDEFLFALDPHDWDTDDDGLTDGYEVFMATHEEYEDGDFDYMNDAWEIFYGFRPYSSADNTPYKDGPNDDFDNDGLTNYEECNVYLTNPINSDTDGDGLSDGWEVTYGYDPLSKHSDTDGLEDGYEVLVLGTSGIYTDSEEDGIGDGLLDNEEVALGTDPMSKDTDNDGLEDGYEVHTYDTDPLGTDTDNDELLDGSEVSGHLWWDPFKQGGAGYIEVFANPADNDTDDDGLLDGEELGRTEYDWNGGDVYYYDTPLYFATLGSPDNYLTSHGSLSVRRTNPDNWDSDGDGASDGDNAGVFEWDDSNPNDKHWKTDPLATDTDGDNLDDYTEMHGWDIYYDSNSDGYGDTWLYGATSNPRKTDSDGDNIDDKYEHDNGYYPTYDSQWNGDWDHDGLLDNEEILYMNGQDGIHYHHNGEGSDLVTWTSNPWDADTDGDGLTDHQEWHGPDPTNHPTWYSDPRYGHTDTDSDSISDYEEFNTGNDGYITNPSNNNTDGDTMLDAEEISLGLNPTTPTDRPYWYIYDPNDSTPAHIVDTGSWSVTPTDTDYGTAMQYADTSYYTKHTWGSVFGGSGNHYWYLHGYDSIPSAARNSNFQGEVRIYLTYYVHYALNFDYIKMNLVFNDGTSLGYFQVIGNPGQGWHTTSFAFDEWTTKVQNGKYVDAVYINVNSWIGAGQYVSWDQISIKYNY